MSLVRLTRLELDQGIYKTMEHMGTVDVTGRLERIECWDFYTVRMAFIVLVMHSLHAHVIGSKVHIFTEFGYGSQGCLK